MLKYYFGHCPLGSSSSFLRNVHCQTNKITRDLLNHILKHGGIAALGNHVDNIAWLIGGFKENGQVGMLGLVCLCPVCLCLADKI